jgi:hypothetical protein
MLSTDFTPRSATTNTGVTDAAVETLTALKDLRDLKLSSTPITDAAFTSLKKLPKLRNLMLWKVRVSEAALKKFQKARPKCKVSQ